MYRMIVVPIDGSPNAQRAVPVAAALARRDGAALRIVLVHEPLLLMDMGAVPVDTQLETSEREYAEKLAGDIAASYGIDAAGEVLEGVVHETICEEVRRLHADLIVMTTHGRTGFNRFWVGSIADAIMRNAAIPVLMLRITPEEEVRAPTAEFHRIVLPLDGSALATQIVAHAVQLGGLSTCRYVLARVVPPVPEVTYANSLVPPSMLVTDVAATAELVSDATEDAHKLAATLREMYPGLELEVVVRAEPSAADGLLDIAKQEKADLVAIATHGRGVSRLVMGSVADKVLRGGTTPMLLYRPVHD